MNKLVSIITPCYNGESFVRRFLDSVLNQTYDNIELYFVNDGSTDRTEEIVLPYIEKFSQKGYELIYIKQKNAGQSAAINKGLERFRGYYMTWIDSDDYLLPEAIKRKVEFMDSNPNIGLCICKVNVVEDKSFRIISTQQRIPPKGNDDFFSDLIRGKNVFYTPGGYMVRSSMFRAAMPEPLQIQTPREIGQNFQLLLPISYKFPVGYINEMLFNYTVRAGSHSRVKHTFEEELRISGIGRDVLLNILADIKPIDEERKRITCLIEERYICRGLTLMKLYGRKEKLKEYITRAKNLGVYTQTVKSLELELRCPIIAIKNKFKRLLKRFANKLKN